MPQPQATVILAEVSIIGITPDRITDTLIKEAKKHSLYPRAINVIWRHNIDSKTCPDYYTIQVIAQVLEQDLFWETIKTPLSIKEYQDPYLQTR